MWFCTPVASGEGQESEELDRETKKYIYTNVEDLKRAQVSIEYTEINSSK